MAESKHTKGPWRAIPDYPEYGFESRSLGNFLIESANDPVAYSSDCVDEEVEAANARLIAAAPELLEAVEECAGLAMQYGDGGPRSEVFTVLYNRLRAAIAKATEE